MHKASGIAKRRMQRYRERHPDIGHTILFSATPGKGAPFGSLLNLNEDEAAKAIVRQTLNPFLIPDVEAR